MHLRLMNKLDIEGSFGIIKNFISDQKAAERILGRIRTAIEILDDSYGGQRTSKDMGGFVFFASGEKEKKRILDFYKLEEDSSEYSDIICQTSSGTWYENLYLRNSDDAVIIVYPIE